MKILKKKLAVAKTFQVTILKRIGATHETSLNSSSFMVMMKAKRRTKDTLCLNVLTLKKKVSPFPGDVSTFFTATDYHLDYTRGVSVSVASSLLLTYTMTRLYVLNTDYMLRN